MFPIIVSLNQRKGYKHFYGSTIIKYYTDSSNVWNKTAWEKNWKIPEIKYSQYKVHKWYNHSSIYHTGMTNLILNRKKHGINIRTQLIMVQGQIFKNGVLKSVVDVIKHANFQFYRAYPAGVIWQNRLLTTDICIHTRSTFYSSKNCSVKNMSGWMFNKFLLIMTFLYKCVKVHNSVTALLFSFHKKV